YTTLCSTPVHYLHSFPTRRSSDLVAPLAAHAQQSDRVKRIGVPVGRPPSMIRSRRPALPLFAVGSRSLVGPMGTTYASIIGLPRSEEHTSELQSRENLVCRLLLEK